MTRKERRLLELECICGSTQQAEEARAQLQQAAQVQNDIEASWSLRKLCSVIKREGNGRRLTAFQRQQGTPVVKEVAGEVQVFVRGPWEVPFYVGPLCDYWTIMLKGNKK